MFSTDILNLEVDLLTGDGHEMAQALDYIKMNGLPEEVINNWLNSGEYGLILGAKEAQKHSM